MTPANDNRKDDPGAGGFRRGNVVFVGASVAVVVLALIAGLVVSESPWAARERKLDQLLVVRLTTIETAIASYHRINGKLPVKLTDLLDSPQTIPYGATKETLAEISYTAVPEPGLDYSLCAVFLRSNTEIQAVYQAWQHDAGRKCFALKVPAKSSELGETYFVRPHRL